MIASVLVALAVAFTTTEAYSTTVTLGYEVPPGTSCPAMFVIKPKDSNGMLVSADKLFKDTASLKPVDLAYPQSVERPDATVYGLSNIPAAKYVDIGFHPDNHGSEGCKGIKLQYVGLTPEGQKTSMFTVGGKGPSNGGQLTLVPHEPEYYIRLTRYESEPSNEREPTDPIYDSVTRR